MYNHLYPIILSLDYLRSLKGARFFLCPCRSRLLAGHSPAATEGCVLAWRPGRHASTHPSRVTRTRVASSKRQLEMDTLETVTSYIERHHLLPEAGEIIVGVSGGADSLCLLHLLHRLCGPGKRYPDLCLQVAHLNHKLRGEAGTRDAAAVVGIAASWGLPVTVGEIDVPALARQERRSLEDSARAARYRFLHEVAQGRPIAV